jgi:hypothetical protein
MKNKKKNQVSVSGLLTKYIEPLLTGKEDTDEYLKKAQIGQMAWNYCVSIDNDLKCSSEMNAIITATIAGNAGAMETLDKLYLRKRMLFMEHQLFILNVETRKKPFGRSSLFVESTHASNIGKR